MQVIITVAVQTRLAFFHLFHATRSKGDQIKPETWIDPFDLVTEQAMKMRRITCGCRGFDRNLCHIAISAVDHQMQRPTAAPSGFQLVAKVFAKIRQMRGGVKDRLGQPSCRADHGRRIRA